MVEMKSSGIAGANEGLFAKRDLEMNTTVAFYNGDPVTPGDDEEESSETNNYKIFDPLDMPDSTVDIPIRVQVSIIIEMLTLLFLFLF